MTSRTRLAVLIGVVVAVVFAGAASLVAQDALVVQSTDLSTYPQVSLKVALPPELVPARAGDPQPDFAVRENSVDIAGVEGISATEIREPIDVVLVVDVSGSMRGGPLFDAQAAARGFIGSMGTRDRIALVAFASEPVVLSGFTADRTALLQAVDSLVASGETALYDAIVRSIDLITEEAQGDEQYMIVLSDGGDTTSINSLDSASSAVGQSEVPVYAVALESDEYNPEPLRALAQRSGGRTVSVTESAEFSGIFEEIAQELRNVYTITFTSLEPLTPSLDVEIVVSQGDVRRSTRVDLKSPLYDSSEPAVGPDSGWTAPLANPFWRIVATMFAFAAVGLLVFGLGSILARPSTTLDQLDYYTHGLGGSLAGDLGGPGSGGQRGRVLEAIGALAETHGFTGAVRTKLERAGLPLRPNEYMFFHSLGVIITGLMAYLASGELFVSVIFVVVATVLPIALLEQAIGRRRRRFEEQLPDILSLVAGSLRSGWGISQAFDLVVEEVSEPAATEFRRVQSENRLGLPLEDALGRMAERVDSDDFRWAVAAIAIQRDVGGNLAEVLDTVAATIRERAQLRREVRSLTAESRFSAIVLVILPFFLLVALYAVNPGYMAVLITTGTGLAMLSLGAVLLVIGSFWLMRLTKLEV
ncbi:MAG: VWA domain-containing protein [Coriobacteriia bacterium]|nr:VWA domain-containing protein [Coriobacteriia bacterium]